MKKIGVTVSAVQHRKLANGHKVRVKTGKGILLVNPAKFDILNNNFLRGKAKDITLTAEEIMVNRKLNPEFTNKLKTKTKSAVAKVAESVTPFKIPTEVEAVESKVEAVEPQAVEDMFKPVSSQLKGSGMHYLARAGIGAFLSNKASEALMERKIYGGLMSGTFNMPTEAQRKILLEQRAEEFRQEQAKEERMRVKDRRQEVREKNAGPFGFLVGGEMPNSTTLQQKNTRWGGMIEPYGANNAKDNERYANNMGRGMSKKKLTNLILNKNKVISNLEEEVFGKGGSLTGNFVSLDALQSKPYSENFQFRNMFPPTFTKHML